MESQVTGGGKVGTRLLGVRTPLIIYIHLQISCGQDKPLLGNSLRVLKRQIFTFLIANYCQ